MAQVRRAASDAPRGEAYDRLYSAAYESNDRVRVIEDRWIVIGAGRLTLRSGGLLHSGEFEVDRENKLIHIPYHSACSCPYCQKRAEEKADNHDDLTYRDALETYWSPKSDAGARTIYYGFSDRVVDTVETFFDEVGELDMRQSTINRRVNTLAERAGVDDVYPHALRATAALYWADRGLEVHYLQAMCGWDDFRVARSYIQAAGHQLAQRIEQLSPGSGRPPEPTAELPSEEELAQRTREVTETTRTQTSLGQFEAAADD